jgi:hypothetical protein
VFWKQNGWKLGEILYDFETKYIKCVKKIVLSSNLLLLRVGNFLMWGCIKRAMCNVNQLGDFGAFFS